MLCPICQSEARRFGRNRNGSQRFQCLQCHRTFTEEVERPLGNMRLEAEKAILCLRMLLEGTSIRSVERLTGVNRNTLISLVVTVGKRAKQFLETSVRGVQVNDVQADEIWGFIGCKEKTREMTGRDERHGDGWCFVALERATKLVLCWHLGKRTPADTKKFAEKLQQATDGRFQLSTDGFKPYRTAIPSTFGSEIDFAQLVKVYGTSPEGEKRYSPAVVISSYKEHCCGQPDMGKVCTSHAERANLTIRMTIRRMTRLTNAFSKKWENHEAALALFFAFYNYCRVHTTLKKTPAMASGLADYPWSVGKLLQAMAESTQT
jgi:transposase-like protein/IS1 family transposase